MTARARKSGVDRVLAFLVATLLVAGIFIFASAALGLLARSDVSVTSIAINHIILGIGFGLVALLITSTVHYRVWRRFAPYLFVAALVASALVFVPGIGLYAGGAYRWILIGPVSFQPGEALKIATILVLASYIAAHRPRLHTWRYGLGAFLAIVAAPALVLMMQPDHGTLGILLLATGAMFLAAGVSWRHIGVLVTITLVLFGALAMMRPYVLERMTTFLNPFSDPADSGYQITQSLIAIGSGGLTGRGFGQSVQKFSYLPEPISDSIFAVAAEEWGLLGSLVIIGLFFALAARGLWVAAHAPDYFGGLLAVGIVTYLVGQAFVNIGAMLGLLPLTGIPLVFIRQGGSAMLVALGSVGILLNISRYAKARQRV